MQYLLTLKLKNEGLAFFGPGPAALLELVQQGSSLHQAAGLMNMAYSKAWKIIKRAERELGFALLHRHRGGQGGGGSSLTQEAVVLLANYREFEKRMRIQADILFNECFAEML